MSSVSVSANLPFVDVPNGLAALTKIPPAGLAQINAFVGFLELAMMKNVEVSFPRDFTVDGDSNPFASWWDAGSEETQEPERVIERKCRWAS